MEVCFFLAGDAARGHSAFDGTRISRLQSAAREVEGLRRFVLHLPSGQDTRAPCCVTQWYFDDLDLLEAALDTKGALHAAADIIARCASNVTLRQQAMAVRRFIAPHRHRPDALGERCTYLVSYEGDAVDFNAWLTHYMTNHPPLMTQLPGIRELEIYTRIDNRSQLRHARATAMQRNKVVFDDLASLNAALASPIRVQMKHDFDSFPPYSGATPHYPMRSIYSNLTQE
ncbi:EthD family reductase [Paraburkholderia sp. LEh10]|uniref:EthD family reductase n=1 Tax=Paraburkholderia sp. LEh10 TaxID=2821353 RepID=UPI001AE0F354|nr:EthD family reductase [Paraburkholderia sp. LEh10]MBP0593321.1 EthD family reductase [Paraburkholderia sp. LEh10]